MGSRQASSTIWARWRGGNLRGAPAVREVGEQPGQAALFVAATKTPDSGRVASHLRSDRLHTPALGDGQDDSGVLNLEEGQRSAPGDFLEDRQVPRSERERPRFATTHELSPAESRTRLIMVAASRIPCIIS